MAVRRLSAFAVRRPLSFMDAASRHQRPPESEMQEEARRLDEQDARAKDAQRRLRGSRFEVVDPDDPPEFGEMAEVVLRSLDGSQVRFVHGMELVVPDAADLSVLNGAPIEQVRAITLDGSRWIAICRPSLSLPPGQGKVLTASIVDAKGLSKGAAITVGVGRIVAFTTSLGRERTTA